MLFNFNSRTTALAVTKIILLLLIAGLAGCGTDKKPDAFSFNSVTNKKLQSRNLSNSIFVTGINTTAEISISDGGEYIVGPFTGIDAAQKKLDEAVTPEEIAEAVGELALAEENVANSISRFSKSTARVYDGYEIRVLVIAADTYNTLQVATLSINGVSADYSVMTEADRYPPVTKIFFPPSAFLTESDTVNFFGAATDIDGKVASISVSGGFNAGSASNDPNFPADPKPYWRFNATANNLVTTQAYQIVSIDQASTPNSTSGLPSDTVVPEFPNILINATRGVLTSTVFPNAVNAMQNPMSLYLDQSSNRLLAVDSIERGIFAINLKAPLKITDPLFGARTIFSKDSIPIDLLGTVAPVFTAPVALAYDSANARLLVLDNGTSKSLISVNLNPSTGPEGTRRILSGADVPSTAPSNANPFTNPVAVAYDSTAQRALVLDQNTLLAVNLTSGERTIISSNTIPDGLNQFDSPSAIIYDVVGIRAFVVNKTGTEILAVNLKNPATGSTDPAVGTRVIISNNTNPNATAPLFSAISAIALDTVITESYFSVANQEIVTTRNNRLLVLDNGSDSVLAVNLAAPVTPATTPVVGARSKISDNVTPNAVNALQTPTAISIDPATGQIYVADSQRGILVIHPNTGDRVIISK